PDGQLRPARIVASSAAHLLASRLLDGSDVAAYRAALIGRFAQSDVLGGAGVRTKSTFAPRFCAGSYHNGSIWPWDTGVIADGLRKHGARRAARAEGPGSAHAHRLRRRRRIPRVLPRRRRRPRAGKRGDRRSNPGWRTQSTRAATAS